MKAIHEARKQPIGELLRMRQRLAQLVKENEQLKQEITERRKAEEALQASRTSFDNIVEKNADGIIIVDREGTVCFVNPAAESLFKRETEELVGELFGFPTEAGETTEIEIIRPGAENAVAEMRIVETEWDGAVAYLASLRDITEREQMEEILRESAEKLRTMFESVSDGIAVIDLEGKVLEVNPAHLRMFGYSHKEEVIGTSALDGLAQKDRARVMEEMGKLAEASGAPMEYAVQDKDGREFYAEFTSTVIRDSSGNPAAVISVIRDITERKRAEEALLKQTHDLGERVKELNCLYRASRLMAEPDRSYEEVLQGIADLVPPSWQYPEVTCARISLGGRQYKTDNFNDTAWKQSAPIEVLGEEVGSVEVCYLQEKPAAHEGPFLKEERDLIDGLASQIRRFTERKRAEEAQERLSQQLQEKVSELEVFSYGIAHDLRSPMVSIEGFSRLLRADIENQKMERVQEDIRLLESGIKKMQQFLNRTLEYSRAGYQVKMTMNASFDKTVEDVITEFAEQVRSIGATVSIAETFPEVYVDRIRIMQVLTNLIQNSINYRDKTVPLKIEIGYYWLSEDEVVFFVRDNGVGIDASEAEKVFDLFYRGTTNDEGSGLGLAIAKRIIEAHGGRMWIQGQSAKGTTVCFTLPQQSGINKGDNNGKG